MYRCFNQNSLTVFGVNKVPGISKLLCYSLHHLPLPLPVNAISSQEPTIYGSHFIYLFIFYSPFVRVLFFVISDIPSASHTRRSTTHFFTNYAHFS